MMASRRVHVITPAQTFLIKLAPIGVFFLILSNLFTLDIEDIGQNLGVLVGASIVNMAIHLFVVFVRSPSAHKSVSKIADFRPLPSQSCTSSSFAGTSTPSGSNAPAPGSRRGLLLVSVVVLVVVAIVVVGFLKFRDLRSDAPSRKLTTATASAATMPVTLQVAAERSVPSLVANFTIPLGTLINMDGTAIYFPTVVVFLAATQGMPLNAGDYVIIVLLATLSSIATTPIPSSSLVLTLIIAESVGM